MLCNVKLNKFFQTDLQALDEALADGVKKYMNEMAECPFPGTEVHRVLEDATCTYGKMIRSKLLVLCGMFGEHWEEKSERLYRLAAMVEMTHLASLIHDDIVDDAPIRRGKPSVQSRYGKNEAVYAGDFLMARINYFQAREHMNDAGVILAKTVEAMCVGEIEQSGCRYREDNTVESYMSVIMGKTAALFKAACRIGATETGCSPEVVEKLEKFGEYLGIMFQLRDDLIDFTSDEKDAGKETHKDFRDGIYTMPVLAAMEHRSAREKLLPIMRENAVRPLEDHEIDLMEKYVILYGGVEKTKQEMLKYHRLMSQLLDDFDESDALEMLTMVLDKLEVKNGKL